MDTNSKKVLEAMPSFDKFMELAEEIKKISLDKMVIENLIKSAEATTFQTVMTDPKYFVNGKAVPVSYYENSYKHKGISGETLDLRLKLAEKVAELELKRNQFEVYHSMLELHKTLVYQERVLT